MLGLSDRGAIRDLMGLILAADARGALAALRRQYDYGVDPQSVLRALLEAVHGVTLVKLGTPPDAAQPAEERAVYEEWAAKLSFQALHRLWQLLLRGHDEVARAALPIEAGEMALLRVIHASSLPDPGELARQIASGQAPSPAPSAAAASTPAAPEAAAALPETLDAIMALLTDNRELGLAEKLRRSARMVRCGPQELVLSSSKPLPADLVPDLGEALRRITDRPWRVSVEDAPGAPTPHEAEQQREEAAKQAILDTPIVKAAFEAFPDAELEAWPKPERSTQT
jgi:DNA polymerase-3 subunit gamma/tau